MSKKSKINWKSAIGEIIFIFISITLAIAFDNWNDQRKENIEAHQLVTALLSETTSNSRLIQEQLQLTEQTMESIHALLEKMGPDSKSRKRSTIDSLIFNTLYSPVLYTEDEVLHDLIENGKIDLIDNDSIRHGSLNLKFEKERAALIEQIIVGHVRLQLMPYLSERISIVDMDSQFGDSRGKLNGSAFDIDSRIVLNDFRFENKIEDQYNSLAALKGRYQALLTSSESLIGHLNKSLLK